MAENSRKYFDKQKRLSVEVHQLQDDRFSTSRLKSERKKGKKLKVCTKVVKKNFKAFCKRSSLHGLQYVGDVEISRIERLCWLIAVIVSLAGCSYMISKQWNKWENTPIIVSLSENPTPMWDVPFPAVTICPENKVQRSLLNFTELFDSDNEDTKTDLEKDTQDQLELLCNSPNFMWKVYKRTKNYENEIEYSAKYIEQYAPDIEHVLIGCFWMEKPFECKELFTPIMTDEGFCFTFNMLNAEDMLKYSKFNSKYQSGPHIHNWDIIKGYEKKISEDDENENIYIRNDTRDNGEDNNDDKRNDQNDYYDDADNEGHHKKNSSESHHHQKNVEKDVTINDTDFQNINISGENNDTYIISDSGGSYFKHAVEYLLEFLNTYMCAWNKSIDKEDPGRNAVHDEEFYKTYPRRSNKPGSDGGLVVYLYTNVNDSDYACRWPVSGFQVLLHYPSDYPTLLSGSFKVPIKRDVIAAVDTDIITYSEEIKGYDVKKGNVILTEKDTYNISKCIPGEICKALSDCYRNMSEYLRKGNKVLELCKCYPTCKYITYKPRVSDSQIAYPQVVRHVTGATENSEELFGRLSIYFEDMQFVTSRRSELFGFTDFLANVGGLLGLFSGFGVLSLAEILYFICLCLFKKRGQN